jgi:hypothetical protein
VTLFANAAIADLAMSGPNNARLVEDEKNGYRVDEKANCY